MHHEQKYRFSSGAVNSRRILFRIFNQKCVANAKEHKDAEGEEKIFYIKKRKENGSNERAGDEGKGSRMAEEGKRISIARVNLFEKIGF